MHLKTCQTVSVTVFLLISSSLSLSGHEGWMSWVLNNVGAGCVIAAVVSSGGQAKPLLGGGPAGKVDITDGSPSPQCAWEASQIEYYEGALQSQQEEFKRMMGNLRTCESDRKGYFGSWIKSLERLDKAKQRARKKNDKLLVAESQNKELRKNLRSTEERLRVVQETAEALCQKNPGCKVTKRGNLKLGNGRVISMRRTAKKTKSTSSRSAANSHLVEAGSRRMQN